MKDNPLLSKEYSLVVTTQGPSYPPSELMDQDGNFIVIGKLNLSDKHGECYQEWGSAIVSVKSLIPEFGKNLPYNIIKKFNWAKLSKQDDYALYTLPWPLPCNNYAMVFDAHSKIILFYKIYRV